jgi:hypothetical protein
VEYCYGARTSGRSPWGGHRASPIHRRRARAASSVWILRCRNRGAFASVLQAASSRESSGAALARTAIETMSVILSREHLHTTPGVYAFLGLATLPRFQTKAINAIDGPCVRFPNGFMLGADGVRIKMSEFPTDRKGSPPEGYSVVVSCATPPVPPSLLEAAANPLDVWDHVRAGSFDDVSDWGYE